MVGHAAAVERVARVIRRNYAGFASRRPMGSFLFLGPTGVGKTELARALADVLFGSRDALIRLDMSELSEAHGVSRLIGAPAGLRGLRRRRPADRAGAPAALVRWWCSTRSRRRTATC